MDSCRRQSSSPLRDLRTASDRRRRPRAKVMPSQELGSESKFALAFLGRARGEPGSDPYHQHGFRLMECRPLQFACRPRASRMGPRYPEVPRSCCCKRFEMSLPARITAWPARYQHCPVGLQCRIPGLARHAKHRSQFSAGRKERPIDHGVPSLPPIHGRKRERCDTVRPPSSGRAGSPSASD